MVETICNIHERCGDKSAVLVLSSFDSVQRQLVKKLDQREISNAVLFYDTRPHSNSKIVRVFKAGKLAALCLDFARFAAGANMTNATDIIFVNPSQKLSEEQ